MEQNANMSQRQIKIPPVVWFMVVVLVIGLIANFVFNVAAGTVAYYVFLALMVAGHFFMHGSHGGHGGSAKHQHGPTSTAVKPNKADLNDHSEHTGSCH